MATSITYLDIASEFMKGAEIDALVNKFTPLFNLKGLTRTSKNDNSRSKYLIYFILSGGVENTILQLIKEHEIPFPDEPVILLAHPENNSLPAALEILARLQQENYTGQIFFLSDTQDETTLDNIIEYIRDNVYMRPLSGEKIGLIGLPSDWLIASSPDLKTIKKVWGADVFFVDTEILFRKIDNIPLSETETLVRKFSEKAISIKEPGAEDLSKAIQVYLALKEIIAENNWDSISLRCFDLVIQKNTTGCYALAKLNQDGIPASCEGDLVSLIIMLWARKVTGKTSWMANPAEININKRTLTLAHCTISFDLITNYHIRSHFESGIGIGIEGDIPLSPVTMLRLGGERLDKLWMLEGNVSKILCSDNLCRTQALITVEDKQKLEELLTNPLGNHIVMIKGHHSKSFYDNWTHFFK